MDVLLGRGLFNADVELWRKHRKMSRFAQGRFRVAMLPGPAHTEMENWCLRTQWRTQGKCDIAVVNSWLMAGHYTSVTSLCSGFSIVMLTSQILDSFVKLSSR
jgi:hypothetical protein